MLTTNTKEYLNVIWETEHAMNTFFGIYGIWVVEFLKIHCEIGDD